MCQVKYDLDKARFPMHQVHQVQGNGLEDLMTEQEAETKNTGNDHEKLHRHESDEFTENFAQQF